MSTYNDLQIQVASDLRRSNLPNEVAAAILDAIDDHSIERFYFNETTTYSIATVAATDEYAIVDQAPVHNFVMVDWVRALIGNTWVKLRPVTSDEMEYLYATPSNGQPAAWATHADTIRIYPFPDKVYTLRLGGHYRLIPITGPNDSNSWTNEAKKLIRYATLRRLYNYPIRDPNQQQIAEREEIKELEYLRRETDRRNRSGRMKAYYG